MKPVTTQRMAKTLSKIRTRYKSPVAAPDLSARFFNGLKIQHGGPNRESLKMRSPKTEELFAFLVCKGNVNREEIIDTLWNGLEPEKAWKNLNSTVTPITLNGRGPFFDCTESPFLERVICALTGKVIG